MRRSILGGIPAIILIAAAAGTAPSFAQNSDFQLEAHARAQATVKDIGLPLYPGATPFKDKDSDSSSADVGLLLNSFHFNVKAASFVTTDPAERVLQFYRKPMAKFGDVLECDHGKPVGPLTVTRSGLTCGDNKNGRNTGSSFNVSDSGHELRAGTPQEFRIVGIDNTSSSGKTRFGLVALILPRDGDAK
jgi:hypothetical protein